MLCYVLRSFRFLAGLLAFRSGGPGQLPGPGRAPCVYLVNKPINGLHSWAYPGPYPVYLVNLVEPGANTWKQLPKQKPNKIHLFNTIDYIFNIS